ncbi:MAG: homoserine O-succinyltransferase [Clostridiales bacterium]|nr:homoserine O-succinyltransferase [Clostridiales bacterium]
MPLKIPEKLPAYSILSAERIFVMDEDRAFHQDIRPLKLALLNLMPTKIVTETQLMRKLSNTPLQIEIDLIRIGSHTPKNTSMDHMAAFYKTFEEVADCRYDGMIITGAPVENLDFTDVRYWDELCAIMEWTRTHVYSTFHICWGAQAGLYYHHNIPKLPLDKKLFGVFLHTVQEPNEPLFRGFDDRFYVPHSRYTTVAVEDILSCPTLRLMAISDEAGVFACMSTDRRQVFITGHPEYDTDTLDREYRRDLDKGLDIDIPKNYYPNNDPTLPPLSTWRSHGELLYTNWLNYYVYQETPYDLNQL